MNRVRAWMTLPIVAVLAAAPAWAAGQPATRGRLLVAVTEPDIEAIVVAVGGDTVDTFSLFKGCIVRKGLQVEGTVRDRLAKADAVVWTGFFNESAAINDAAGRRPGSPKPSAPPPAWIDVSKGAARVNVPCAGRP